LDSIEELFSAVVQAATEDPATGEVLSTSVEGMDDLVERVTSELEQAIHQRVATRVRDGETPEDGVPIVGLPGDLEETPAPLHADVAGEVLAPHSAASDAAGVPDGWTDGGQWSGPDATDFQNAAKEVCALLPRCTTQDYDP
jgi:hypothetical protein